MPKNIVIGVDGANNEFRANNTNVVKLFQSLVRDNALQSSYYTTGVGTLTHESRQVKSSSWMETPEEREGFTGHDLRGAVGEGFGETSPVEWVAAHAVAAGESLFPGTPDEFSGWPAP
jgi:Uncharacterized alpha/beta hydrolase domain (DUF2235)